MRTLFLTTVLPSGDGGAHERSASIFRALQACGPCQLVWLRPPTAAKPSYYDERWETVDLGEARRGWGRVADVVRMAEFRPNPPVAARVALVAAKHRAELFVNRYFPCVQAGTWRLGPSILDVDDLPYEALPKRNALHQRLFRRAVHRVLRRYDGLFLTKPSDADKVGHPNCRVLPCISTKSFELLPRRLGDGGCGIPVDAGARPTLLFVGDMNWPPNFAGVKWFVESVFPRVRSLVPGVVLRVVGRRPPEVPMGEGVTYTGFLEGAQSLAREQAEATVFVCPIRQGAGSPVKLAEAISAGQAVVATTFAARGFQGFFEPGRDLLVADDPDAFGDQIVRVLRDPRLAETLRRSAYETGQLRLSQAAVNRIVAEALHGMRDASPSKAERHPAGTALG